MKAPGTYATQLGMAQIIAGRLAAGLSMEDRHVIEDLIGAGFSAGKVETNYDAAKVLGLAAHGALDHAEQRAA